MTTQPPAYRDHGNLHRADTCQPLVEAASRGEVRLEALVRGNYPGSPMPEGAVPQVRSVGFWDARRGQNWGLPEHRNEGIELTYLESGRVGFAVEGRAHPLRAGDLTVTRPWQPHSVGDPLVAEGRLHWIILDVGVRQPHPSWRWPPWLVLTRGDLGDLTDMLRQNEQPVWRATQEVGACFAEIGRLVESASRVATLGSRLAMRINELFVCVLEMLRQHDVSREPALIATDRTVEMFLRRLEATPDEPWTLDTMAEQTGLKRTRFAHYCRKLTNRTPLQYLNDVRIGRARELIAADPARSLTDVAFACGFSSSQYFATTFKRVAGCSPRAYRAAS